MSVALVHDYLTQRGGAERVVLALTDAFPGAPLYTALFEPARTFPEFASHDVRTTHLDAMPWVRRNHRLALPLLAPAFGRLEVEADVAVCSSSGWAHGAGVSGRKVVYCHAPARWLYQTKRYAPRRVSATRAGLAVLKPVLSRWDRRAAASAHRYLVNSNLVRDQVARAYGIDAEVVPPPPAIDPGGAVESLGVGPGFFLCVSRLLPYKNVEAVVAAFAGMPGERLLVIGEGPGLARLQQAAAPNVLLVGSVGDAALRWAYSECLGLVAPSFEDYGLTPLEAACFGKPTAALRYGGYLDTVVEDASGAFFDTPEPKAIAAAVRRLRVDRWDAGWIRRHAGGFSAERFVARIRAIVAEELSAA